jgi:hypothetical protein
MRRIQNLTTFGIILVLAFFIGCQAIPLSSIPMITESPVKSITATSVMKIPTTPTATVTPFLPTAIPGLSVAEAKSKVEDYLSNGPNCHLPCWLGITPGQTIWQAINQQIHSFHNFATEALDKSLVGDRVFGKLRFQYTDNNATIDINSSFSGPRNDETISVISIHTQVVKPFDDPDRDLYGYAPYNEMLKAYTLSAILSSEGVPSDLHVFASLRGDTTVTPGFGDYFLLHLLYPDKGILMEYKMKVEGDGSNYRICPTTAWINGYLTQPNLGTKYGEVLAAVDGKFSYISSPPQNPITFEEAFGMNIDEFYQVFLSTPNRCLETPISLWYHK